MNNKNTLGKALFAGIVITLIWLALALSSCTTMRNATKRHDKIVRNFPSVHQIDTFVYQLIDTIEIEGIKGVDTMYFDISRIDTIRDTFYLTDSTMVINTIWKREGSNYALKTDIRQPNKVKVINREIKIPVIVKQNYFFDRLKWFTIGGVVCSLLTGAVLIWMVRR